MDREVLIGSTSIRISVKVISPQFSMALKMENLNSLKRLGM